MILRKSSLYTHFGNHRQNQVLLKADKAFLYQAKGLLFSTLVWYSDKRCYKYETSP